MKKTLEYSTAKESALVEYMVKSRPKGEKIKRPMSAAQSLYENREKDPAAYKAYLERPMVTVEQARANDVNIYDRNGRIDADLIYDLVGARTITPEEYEIHSRHRKQSKNTLGDSFDFGSASSVSPERKEIAISAFTCSPPAELTEEQKKLVKKLDEIQTPQKKLSMLESIKQKIKSVFVQTRKFKTSSNKHGDIIYHYDEDEK